MMRTTLSRLCVALMILITLTSTSVAQPDAADEARERAIMDRFLSLLEQRPRYGTALDKVYGYHVERGTLDELTQRYEDRIQQDESDGKAWMVLGMIEFQRGREAQAVKAFRGAEEHLPEEALASYYLGKSLLLVGQPQNAAKAFERAVEKDPQRTDMLEIFQALGRIHQRAQRNEEALDVWDRLEKLFPDDVRVQEQIADILSDEGDNEGALKRYEKLAGLNVGDRYQKVQHAIKAAELKVKLGRSKQAIADFEKLLTQLKPDSWLHRDVRTKIETVFLRTDDYAGLTDYYAGWVETHPDDIAAMTRLARTLSLQGRDPEAQKWYETALKKAPSNLRLRKSLIDRLVQIGEYDEAIAQYEKLNEYDPNNPDNITQWGLLILGDKQKPLEDRQQRAATVWNKLIEEKPDDPIIAVQVADMFRSAKMQDEALGLYEQAVSLSPNDPQYREYLGEYYHKLERPADAKNTWKVIAEGDNRSTRTLIRLGEVYAGFGYHKEALEEFRAAMELKPEFSDRIRFAELLRDNDRVDDSLEQLAIVEPLAENPEERMTVIESRIKSYQAGGRLKEETAKLQASLDAGEDVTADRWALLALLYEADRKLSEANDTIRKSLKLDSASIVNLSIAARIFEDFGQLVQAVEANVRLAEVDRQYRTEYLARIAGLQMRLGQVDDALQSGRDLIAAAPGNPESYQFFAELCFQLGKPDEGLETLRKSVRLNPDDEDVLLSLASALAGQFKTDEAIELYWRAFDKADDVDAKVGIVVRLTDLYLQTNQFDRLITRLENMQRDSDSPRDLTIALANAHGQAGDLGMSRITLEGLLTEESRDTALLNQLARLAEKEGDYDEAVKFQRRLADVAPDKQNTMKLAGFLLQQGNVDEAEAIWLKLVETERDRLSLFKAMDSLIRARKYDAVAGMADRLLRQDPKDWEALCRKFIAEWAGEKQEQAVADARKLLAMNISDDELSAQAEYVQKQREKNAKYRKTRGSSSRTQYPAVLQRTQSQYQLSRIIDPSYNSRYGGQPAPAWSPDDFGQARGGAWILLGMRAQTDEKLKAELEEFTKKGLAEDASHRDRWDVIYLTASNTMNDADQYRKRYEVAKAISQALDPDACLIYLTSLSYRTFKDGNYNQDWKTWPALEEEELQHVVDCYEVIRDQKPQWMRSYYNPVTAVIRELQIAEKDEQAQQLLQETVENANDEQEIVAAANIAAQLEDVDMTLKLMEKLIAKQAASSSRRGSSMSVSANTLGQLFVSRMDEGAFDDVFRLLDASLEAAREQRANASPTHRYAAPSSRSSSTRVYTYRRQHGRVYTTSTNIEYPTSNTYYDMNSISMLYNSFTLFKEKEKLDVLLAHLSKDIDQYTGDDRAMAHLALCYVYWWAESQSQALDQMKLAFQATPDDFELRLELAVMLQQVGSAEESLALIDEVEPLNQTMMQRREMVALQLAMLAGNTERAEKAAERLFGVRMDTDSQVQLAGFMNQLGMNEMAESVLNRARRRAGGRIDDLLKLMRQYESQDDDETAVQIAYQIMLRTGSVSGSSSRNNSAKSARTAAMSVLKKSGQLDDLIDRTLAQIERSPKAAHLYEQLASYYQAANKKDEARDALAKVAELKGNDPQAMFNLAQQLQNDNKDAACDAYLKAFRGNPSLFRNNYYQYRQLFEQAKRLDDLIDMLLEIDVRQLGGYHVTSDIVRGALKDKKQRKKGLELFARTWDAYPDQRAYLIGNMHDSEIWEIEEMYDYVRKAVIPQGDTTVQPWQAVEGYNVLTRLVQAGQSQGKFDELKAEAAAAIEEYPDWKAGRVVLATLCAKSEEIEKARDLMKQVMDEVAADESVVIPIMARYQVGMQLETAETDELRQTCIRWYEQGLDEQNANPTQFSFGSSPAMNLAKLYVKVDRKDEAKALVMKLYNSQDYSRYGTGNTQYVAYQRLNAANSVGTILMDMGFFVDALRVYNEMLSNPQTLQNAKRYGNNYEERLRKGAQKAKESLNADTLAEALSDWVQVPNKVVAAPVKTNTLKGTPAASQDPKEKNDDIASTGSVDFMLMVQPRDLTKAEVTSLFAMAVSTAIEKKIPLDEARKKLDAVREQSPDDLSLLIADALLAIEDETAVDRRKESLTRLSEHLAAHPLTDLPETGKPTLEQRKQAEVELPVWLVARTALGHKETRKLGEALTDRALAAADRHEDSIWRLAMLREAGQRAIDAGDREIAEKYWGQMLDDILEKPDVAVVNKKDAGKSLINALRGFIAP